MRQAPSDFFPRRPVVGRRVFLTLALLSLLFTPGIIPSYLVVKQLGLLNTYASLGPAQITDDARGAARALAERLKERYGSELTEDEVLESPHAFIGTVDQVEQKCLMLRERYGLSYIFPIAEPEAFAPIVERLAGK